MKIFKKGFIILAILIFSGALLLSVGWISLSIYSRANIDSAGDEALFSAAKKSNVSKFYANGAPIGSDEYIPIEIKAYTGAQTRKEWISENEVSDYLKNGFIAVEDREFYTHEGVNVRRTVAALLNSIFKFDKRFGASTITQQVVKNISGDNEITIKRKLNEIIRATKIEKNHSKEEILEVYMNIIPLGERCVGVNTASETYFRKTASNLTLPEAATLVGITNAPSKLNPYSNPKECIERRNYVINSMYECGMISLEERNTARLTPLTLAERRDKDDFINSWFVETVIEDLVNDLSLKFGICADVARSFVRNSGLSVYTTENIGVQTALENYFENQISEDVLNSGVDFSAIIVDSRNGNLLGIVGNAGKKAGNRMLNHATVPHPPASTLKPLALYAPLIDSGKINWSTVFDDSPVLYQKKDGEMAGYPKNSPDKYNGDITVYDALKLSKNTVAVRLYEILGAKSISKGLIENFGFDTIDEKKDLAPSPLALGQLSVGISLRKLVDSYTVFPANGVLNKERSYVLVTDTQGNEVLRNEKESKKIFKDTTAKIMNQMLVGVVCEGTAKSIKLKDTVDTAGKTGTSAANRDKLFIGYTPYITFGIWCGYEKVNGDASSVHPGNLEIWDKIAAEIHNNILLENKEDEILHFDTTGILKIPFIPPSENNKFEEFSKDEFDNKIEFGYFTEDNCPEEKFKVQESVDKSEFDRMRYERVPFIDELERKKSGFGFYELKKYFVSLPRRKRIDV